MREVDVTQQKCVDRKEGYRVILENTNNVGAVEEEEQPTFLSFNIPHPNTEKDRQEKNPNR